LTKGGKSVRLTAVIRFLVVVPTKGRPTLGRALDSLNAAGFGPRDLLSISAEPSGGAAALSRLINPGRSPFLDGLAGRGQIIIFDTPDGPADAGSRGRNLALSFAPDGSHVLYLDDDDAFLPGSFDVMREKVAGAPADPHVFRMRGELFDGALWRKPELRFGNVGGPMFVAPLGVSRLHAWGKPPGADFAFITKVVHSMGGPERIHWHEDVTYLVRPKEEDRDAGIDGQDEGAAALHHA